MAPYVFFSSWVSPAKTWWPKIENVVAKNWKLSINWAFGKIGRLRARGDFAIHPSDSYIDNVRKTGELSEHLPRCNVVKMHLCSAGAQKITRWEFDVHMPALVWCVGLPLELQVVKPGQQFFIFRLYPLYIQLTTMKAKIFTGRIRKWD